MNNFLNSTKHSFGYLLSILLSAIFLFCLTNCEKENNIMQTNNEISYTTKNNLIGTWVEKYPKKFDGISDTIVFNLDSTVNKYFLFPNWKYKIKSDTIQFINPTSPQTFSFSITTVSENEIIFKNFIDRLFSTEVKNITYVKK